MVESSAAALKSFLLSGKRVALILDKERGNIGGFLSLFSESLKQGTFVQLFRTVGLLCCPNKKKQSLLAWTVKSVKSGWHCRFCLTRDLQKKKNLLLWTFFFFCHRGAPQVSLRHPLAFHASWYYHLFIPPLFKLDADPVALDMCKQIQCKQKKKTDHFKYF